MSNTPWQNETERADYWKSAWNTENKENESLVKERDTLKKALELVCAHQSIQQWGLNTAQEIYDYFIQQAQEQEGKK